MAKATSIRQRAHRIENEYARYFGGIENLRDHKEQHDVSFLDHKCNVWLAEIKSGKTGALHGAFTKLLAAFNQCQRAPGTFYIETSIIEQRWPNFDVNQLSSNSAGYVGIQVPPKRRIAVVKPPHTQVPFGFVMSFSDSVGSLIMEPAFAFRARVCGGRSAFVHRPDNDEVWGYSEDLL